MMKKIPRIISKKKMRKIKRTINRNKPIIFLFAILGMVTIGNTFASFYTQHVEENNFVLADYNITLSEYFPVSEWNEAKKLDKEVKLTNSGTGVLLRVTFNEMWYNGTEILNNRHEGTMIVKKNWTDEFISDFEYSDGWYYYKKVFTNGQEIILLESIEKVVDVYNESTNTYELDINYEVLQAKDVAAERVWGKRVTIEGSNVIWEL